MSKASKTDLSKQYKQLQEIIEWFEQASPSDINQALDKHKQGQELVDSLQKSLAEVQHKIESLGSKPS